MSSVVKILLSISIINLISRLYKLCHALAALFLDAAAAASAFAPDLGTQRLTYCKMHGSDASAAFSLCL